MADAGKTDDFDFGERFTREYAKARQAVLKPSILVMGGTGAGKSTLVNMAFGEDVAKVGAGKPVTEGIVRYEDELIKIFDSEGYEAGQQKQDQFKARVVNFIQKDCPALNERVHMVWYCISLANHRVLDIDINTINAVAKLGVPIVVVLTQADCVSEADGNKMQETVTAGCAQVAVFSVSKDPATGMGVDALMEWSYRNLDAGVRTAFVAAAKGQIKLKQQEASLVIKHHIGLAAVIAASPIPFSDAPLLLGNQATMLARITSVWDMPNVRTLAGGAVFGQVVAQVGRSLAGNLVKLIPGAGSLVGGSINAAVASTFTAAIGHAVSEICARVVSDDLNGVLKPIADYFDGDTLMALVKAYMGKHH